MQQSIDNCKATDQALLIPNGQADNHVGLLSRPLLASLDQLENEKSVDGSPVTMYCFPLLHVLWSEGSQS